ncbi:MAG TPA: mechanosensitive ion channel domain-containing protein [Patescibacteria group bacterium]|nr:mechanosensitive ion channel domain-containing protein [Patescibacteria group bacterium]
MRQTIRWAVAVALLALVGLSVVGLELTRAPSATSFLRANRGKQSGASSTPVDQTPLLQARRLAALAVTPQEQSLSNQAVQLADHEVDLAFAAALRNAAAQPAPTTPKTLQLQRRVKQAQAQVDSEKATVKNLTVRASRARGLAQTTIQSQLELAQAQMELDRDELADAQRDLMREGGGQQAGLQEMLEEHEKSPSHAPSQPPAAGATEAAAGAAPASAANQPGNARSLLARLSAWTNFHDKQELLERAHTDALGLAAALGHAHDGLERTIQAKQSQDAALNKATAAGSQPGATASELASVRQLSRYQQDLSTFDQRIETEQELADVYRQWGALVATNSQAALHRLIRSFFWVLLLLLLTVTADLLISRLFGGLSLDRKRLHTIRSVLHFTTRAVATVLILIVIFGPPQQLATVLGLAGAGLAVALKDFIIAFFGWFVLMGPHGMRPGDWVEINTAQQINGVQGKVIEVGLLFTVILETGNWTDAGNPTGRRVAFMNSFAIEGYFLNFTTAGQWLWDEVQVGLPVGVDPYPVLDALRKVAEKETERNIILAEQDWKRAMDGSGLGTFSAAPVITVRPTEAGLNVVVRYIASADEREELRLRLFRAAFEILHGAGALAPAAETAPTRSEPA